MLTLSCIVLFMLLLCSAFFSGSETALFSLSPVERERRRSDKRYRFVLRLLTHSKQTLITILLGNLFVNISATIVGERIFNYYFGENAQIITFVTMTFLILLFGEILPKTLAINNADRFSRMVSPLLHAVNVLLTPLRAVLERAGDLALRLFGRVAGAPGNALTREEWIYLLQHRRTAIKDIKKRLALRMVRSSGRTARDILTPRHEMIAFPAATTVQEVLNRPDVGAHSRYPVYSGDIDTITGYVHLKDLFCATQRTGTVCELCRPALFVPHTRNAVSLFREMVDKSVHLAVVVNEFGGTAGIVTMNDILEKVIGGVREDRQGDSKVVPLPGTMYLAEGMASLEEVAEHVPFFSVPGNAAGVRTLNGLVTLLLGRIPRNGENIELSGYKMYILKANKTRVEKVFISQTKGE